MAASAAATCVLRLQHKNTAAHQATRGNGLHVLRNLGTHWRRAGLPAQAPNAVHAAWADAAEPHALLRPSFLLDGWSTVQATQAARLRPLRRTRYALVACGVGAAVCVAGLATGLAPLLAVGLVPLLLGAVAVWALRRRLPSVLPQAAALPHWDRTHLGSRQSILRALGAVRCERAVLNLHRQAWDVAADTTPRAALLHLRAAIHAAAAVKVHHLDQERVALLTPGKHPEAQPARQQTAQVLTAWQQCETQLTGRSSAQVLGQSPWPTGAADAAALPALSDAASLRLVWNFLNSRDALDGILAALPAGPSPGWIQSKDNVPLQVNLAAWQDGLRTGDDAARQRLQSFCHAALQFALRDYPLTLDAQANALHEHWVSREALR